MAIRAVLFDLDGTLVDTERESAEAMARALARGLGIEVSPADRDFIIGRSWVEIYANLRDHHPGLSWSRDQVIAATAAERVGVFAEMGITVLPGAADCLDRLSSYPLALVTGSSREEAGQVLSSLGWHDRFAIVLASEDVSRSKPAPDGYLAAAAALGVEAVDCLVVEDSRAGIAAGRTAGARVVAVEAGNFAHQDQSAANLVIASLEQLTMSLVSVLGEAS